MTSRLSYFGLFVASTMFAASAVAFGVLALRPARYQIAASADRRFVWRIDTVSGELSMCTTAELDMSPQCSPWGDQVWTQPILAKQSPAVIKPAQQFSDEDILNALGGVVDEPAASPGRPAAPH